MYTVGGDAFIEMSHKTLLNDNYECFDLANFLK